MACPHVSGAAALLLSAEPSLTQEEVLAKLVEAATPDAVIDAKADSPNLLLYSAPPGSFNALVERNSTVASSCSAPVGHCGRAYQACCIGFGADGHPCGCKLQDGAGKAGADCGTCGTG